MILNQSVESFIEEYIDYIDKEEWDYVYQQAEIHMSYPYELTSKLLEAGINPLENLTVVPFSYAPLELDSAILNPKCTTIQQDAFNSCEKLTHIILPEGLVNIDTRAFSGSGLVEINFPSTLEMLGPAAFSNCKNLKKISYNGTIDQMNQVRVWEEVFDGVPAYYIECTDGNIELRDIDE